MLSDLRAHILDDSTVGSLVASRMYPVVLPQDTAFPALSYNEVSAARLYDLCGPDGRVRPRITINSWAETYLQARALADAVRRAINGFRGVTGSSPGTRVDDVKLENELDMFEEEAATKGIYRVMQDYMVSYQED